MPFTKKSIRVLSLLFVCSLVFLSFSGCAWFKSEINDLKGSITGNTYRCEFYSNYGERFMTVSGKNIDINSNIVREQTYSEESGWGYSETLSSVLTLTVDGHQIESCGSTILFIENGLEPDVDFQLTDIKSNSEHIGDYAFIANIVNQYKNYFGKPVVVVIQGQEGQLIESFSGNEVYWKVCEDLPKTTKLMIDGKALYIHRANFQIIDKALLG